MSFYDMKKNFYSKSIKFKHVYSFYFFLLLSILIFSKSEDNNEKKFRQDNKEQEYSVFNNEENFRNFRSLLDSNKTSNSSENQSISQSIKKTRVDFLYDKNKNILCKENYILKLLPNYINDNIKDYLNEIPMVTNSKKCKISKSDEYFSCCNKNTISLFEDYTINYLIILKNQIFQNNLYLLSLVKNEHQRNFVDGFGADLIDFNDLFNDFQEFKLKIFNLTRSIITESVIYSWNSLCNYVCRPDFFKLYTAYNLTYLKNDTYSSSVFFEYYNDNNKINKINGLVKKFFEEKYNMNGNLGNIYAQIITKSPDLKYSNSNNQTLSLVKKSLGDGQNFFYNSNNPFPCEKRINLTKYDCNEILAKNICKTFLCLDNILFQFIDTSAESIVYDLSNYNYSDSLFLDDQNDFIILENDIDNNIVDMMNFTNSQSYFYVIHSFFIIFFFIF